MFRQTGPSVFDKYITPHAFSTILTHSELYIFTHSATPTHLGVLMLLADAGEHGLPDLDETWVLGHLPFKPRNQESCTLCVMIQNVLMLVHVGLTEGLAPS